MGDIFLHQLHDNLRSLRFQVSLGVLLLFFVANGVIYTMKTGSLTVEAARINTLNEERFDRVNTVQDAATNTYKIRSTEVGTEFIAESGSNWFLYAMYVSPSSGSVPGFGSSRTTNHWMRRFEVVDWTVIVRYVLSFLCIVLSYNAISGELERGTLHLVLANSLPRGSFLLGKFAAHLITLLVATALGSLISLLILVLGKVIELDLHIWQRYVSLKWPRM
jgi:ABC-type transport system involved in multi-copper enzyme maturation permease subunit